MSKQDNTTKNKITCELVIPSYNRPAVLRETYRHIRKLYPDLAICLGLQGKIYEVPFQMESRIDPRLRIIHLAKPSPTVALNRCIQSSKAELILILDDDAVPCPGWLEAYVDAFQAEPGLLYAAGREIRLNRGRSALSEMVRISVELIHRLFIGQNKTINGRIVGWVSWWGLVLGNFTQPGTCLINTPRGCNMALQRKILEQIDSFNENFRGNFWGWESEWGVRMQKRGHHGKYFGSAIVIHSEAPTGGCRVKADMKAFRDYIHNHRLLIRQLGPQAWIGSLPRLIRFLLRMK